MAKEEDGLKKQAAEAAVAFVKSGMVLGLGHGSTVQFALECLAEKLKGGDVDNIFGIPCSQQTETEARRLGIPLADLNDHQQIDLTLDGADEVDPDLNLIKGGGGALLREKIVAQASRRVMIMVDEGKLSEKLGTSHALPIEVIPFGWQRQRNFVEGLGGKATLRANSNGEPVLSNQGNYLLDCHFGPIEDLETLAHALESRAGIVEHGLFLNLATDVIVAGVSGLRHLKSE